jgi:hypothetical protein
VAGLQKFIGSAFPDVNILFSQMFYISQNNRYYYLRNPHAVEENACNRFQDTVEFKVPLILDQLRLGVCVQNVCGVPDMTSRKPSK